MINYFTHFAYSGQQKKKKKNGTLASSTWTTGPTVVVVFISINRKGIWLQHIEKVLLHLTHNMSYGGLTVPYFSNFLRKSILDWFSHFFNNSRQSITKMSNGHFKNLQDMSLITLFEDKQSSWRVSWGLTTVVDEVWEPTQNQFS